jgi:hypothetical protein
MTARIDGTGCACPCHSVLTPAAGRVIPCPECGPSDAEKFAEWGARHPVAPENADMAGDSAGYGSGS